MDGLGLIIAMIVLVIIAAISEDKQKKKIIQMIKEETQSLREKNMKLEKRIEILERKPPE